MTAPALTLSILLAAPPALAQPVACAFTLVCAPEIDCEAHEGIPFELAFEDGRYSLEVDDQPLTARPLARFADGGLGLVFEAEGETLLFTLTPGNEGVLTRHRIAPGGRLGVASFIGPCVRG
ncbi:hypothetical protein roselon_02990 [Roseibacterium elongatum DSM 19469]|uniref:Uncharacterized protein n=1 Tax=Roseicyclus elongatus DSM 19469 TaxID=1294273 RepID=W8S8G8_9RHOB|nr:hypothetical protein [Roseibacterium elongatum]AHM05271.1 hypothetical protein roselon_02990 [Roseibacterium elongatum DSM 19469]